MAYPQYGTRASTTTGSTTQSEDVVCPSTVAANDILIAVVIADNIGASAVISPPDGSWTELCQDEYLDSVSDHGGIGGVWWKRAVGDEDGTTVTFTHNGSTGNGTCFFGVIWPVTGCYTSGNFYDDFKVSYDDNGTSPATCDAPSIGATDSTRTQLYFMVQADNISGGASGTFTAQAADNTSTGSDASIVAFRIYGCTSAESISSTTSIQTEGLFIVTIMACNTAPVSSTTATAASTLSGALSCSSTVSYTPPARTLDTVASTLTGALSSSADIYSCQLSAASTLTGMVSSDATVDYTPPARTLDTVASELTGTLSSSADITAASSSPITLDTVASTLTGALSSSATVKQGKVVGDGLVAEYVASKAKGSGTFGYTSTGTVNELTMANGKWVNEASLPVSGAISKLTAYISNVDTGHTAAKGRAVIYEHVADAPDNLIAAGVDVDIADNLALGWVDFPFAVPVDLAPGDYFIGLHCDGGSTGVNFRKVAVNNICKGATDTFSDGSSDPFGTATTYTTRTFCVYATYTCQAPGNNTDPTSTWDDLVGSNDGTLTGFAWDSSGGWTGTGTAADPYGLQFDNTDSIVSLGDFISDSDENVTVTLETWFSTPTESVQSNVFICLGRSSSTVGYPSIAMYTGTTHHLSGMVRNDDGGLITQATASTDDDGTIHHAILTTDSGYMRLYFDGSQVGDAVAIPDSVFTFENFLLGARTSTPLSLYYRGILYATRVYDRALTADEISENYNAGVLAASKAVASTAASTLSGTLSSTADITAGSGAITVDTAASTLTGALSSDVSLDYTPLAITSTSETTLTGALSSDASVTNLLAITSTAASTFTGALTASAEVSSGAAPVTLDTVASTLTGALSSACTISEEFTVAPESTLTAALTGTAYAAREVTVSSVTGLEPYIAKNQTSNVTVTLSFPSLSRIMMWWIEADDTGNWTGAGVDTATNLVDTVHEIEVPAPATLKSEPYYLTTYVMYQTDPWYACLNYFTTTAVNIVDNLASGASTLSGPLSSDTTVTYTPIPVTVDSAASTLTGALSSNASVAVGGATQITSASSTLTGSLSASADVDEEFTVNAASDLTIHNIAIDSSAASTLTGSLSSSATIAGEFYAASTLTGALSSSATITSLLAITSTAASQFTGALSASAGVTNTPPARTSTAASQLTGSLSSSASVTAGGTSTTLTAASDLSLHSPANFKSTGASSLTAHPTSSASIVNGILNISLTAASTITENAPQPRMVTGVGSPTARVTSTATLNRAAAAYGASTLTGAISSSADITRSALNTTSTASSTLPVSISSTASIGRQTEATGASDLTGVVSSDTYFWMVPDGDNMVFASSDISASVDSISSITSNSLVTAAVIPTTIGSTSQINREIPEGTISGEGILTSTVSRCRCTIRVRFKTKHTRLYGKIGRVDDTTLRVTHKGGVHVHQPR